MFYLAGTEKGTTEHHWYQSPWVQLFLMIQLYHSSLHHWREGTNLIPEGSLPLQQSGVTSVVLNGCRDVLCWCITALSAYRLMHLRVGMICHSSKYPSHRGERTQRLMIPPMNPFESSSLSWNCVEAHVRTALDRILNMWRTVRFQNGKNTFWLTCPRVDWPLQYVWSTFSRGGWWGGNEKEVGWG